MGNLERLYTLVDKQHEARQVWKEETPEIITGMIKDEVIELDESIKTGEKIEVASEIGDVLFLTFRLCQKMGINPADALYMKVVRNSLKYPDAVMQGDIPRDKAIEILKYAWKEWGGDKKFYNFYESTVRPEVERGDSLHFEETQKQTPMPSGE
jgi:NTP pyrophosphatase (non-canonical NTP hydrolase)